MKPILRHLRGNAIAYLALFVALGGTSYAVSSLPAGSVGARELKNHSITPIKFDRRSIGAYVRAWAVIKNGSRVVASRPRAKVVSWDPNSAGGIISWGSAISRRCFPLAGGGRDFIQAAVLPGARKQVDVHFQVFDNAGHFDSTAAIIFVAVLCPQA